MRQRKLRLLGENRDTALAFKGKRIEKGVPVIDTPQLFERTRLIEHRFGKRCLSGIYVRRYTNTNMFHRFFAFVLNFCPEGQVYYLRFLPVMQEPRNRKAA